VLVEDQLSAISAQQGGVNAVALLGTHLNNDKVWEISQWQPSQVIIALDADATDQAFKLARKWGLAFPKTRVAILARDLKEEKTDDIRYILGLD
jgi:DNA primase